VISVAGASLSQVVGAIVSVLPLDEFVDAPVRRMAIDVTPDELPEVQGEVQRSSTPSVANIGRWVS
jgi:L-fucose mutarotase